MRIKFDIRKTGVQIGAFISLEYRLARFDFLKFMVFIYW
jgi:hypothetical protein